MRFIANLRAATIDSFEAHSQDLAGCLLSSHRATPGALEVAARARASDIPLMADNGTKPLIDDVIEEFSADALPLRQSVRSIRREIGRVPRGSDIPAGLRSEIVALAKAVIDSATRISEAVDYDELLDAQIEMQPDQLIAKEDFATACLLALGLGDRNITGWPIRKIDSRNRRSLRLWARVANDPRTAGVTVYAVLSATDYNTARSAARLAASRGVRHAAVGMAGMAKDPSATDFCMLGHRRMRFSPPVPRRYVRLAEVLRGFARGFAEARHDIESFHCLGLGAPPLQPVAAASFPDGMFLTSDATSPIHEAVKNKVMYNPDDHGRRAATRNVVHDIVQGGEWSFTSPFHARYRQDFGHDPPTGRAWWQEHGMPAITNDVLEEQSKLTAALPLFCEANDDIKAHTAETHIAHNHWLLDRITRDLDASGLRPTNARRALEAIAAGKPGLVTRGIGAAVDVLAQIDAL